MPSNGALTLVKFNSASASFALALALASLASSSATSFCETTFCLEQLLGVVELQLRELGLGHLGVQLRLVESRAGS